MNTRKKPQPPAASPFSRLRQSTNFTFNQEFRNPEAVTGRGSGAVSSPNHCIATGIKIGQLKILTTEREHVPN